MKKNFVECKNVDRLGNELENRTVIHFLTKEMKRG